ncbi:hypothetical protein CCACVL1_26059 [Corchorus capsularis]|uniref:Uncharacterized protein n=1 Tax=Corchorus capsularis TaxID=210143 RepID=A0A1R3GG20_COCAP|nr:hypothetical protein CCACVL1_26059 [Corchorus capsularis]
MATNIPPFVTPNPEWHLSTLIYYRNCYKSTNDINRISQSLVRQKVMGQWTPAWKIDASSLSTESFENWGLALCFVPTKKGPGFLVAAAKLHKGEDTRVVWHSWGYGFWPEMMMDECWVLVEEEY